MDTKQPKPAHVLERNRRYVLESRLRGFGMTPDDYANMRRRQNDLCAICDRPETAKGRNGKTKKLALDHDHETNIPRELLCHRCNNALGFMGDQPELLEKAAAYLRRHAANPATF